jgi:hypothetical protein
MNAPSAERVELPLDNIERCIKKNFDGEEIKLGSGASGDVFLAGDIRLSKMLAVKMVRPTHYVQVIIEEIRNNT